MIRLGTYAMLQRAGYDLSDMETTMTADRQTCQAIIGDRALLFSPAQTIRRAL